MPVLGATVTAKEYVAARELLDEVHEQAWWNPWLLLDPGAEYEAAWKICGQWTTTEPGPPPKTLEEREAELEQRLAGADAQFLAREAQAEKTTLSGRNATTRTGRRRGWRCWRNRGSWRTRSVTAMNSWPPVWVSSRPRNTAAFCWPKRRRPLPPSPKK